MSFEIDKANSYSEELKRVKQRYSIVGHSPALMEAIERALKVAPIDLSVLVIGESGTGKEFFPQIIHQNGGRKHKKYIAVNCGAIPEGTIESELFGHEKGSFTGAVSARKGYFEEADGGTIFLDEVAELPLTTQARLLRVLETGEFLKVGSSVVQHTNVRIVAATNVNLLKAVEKGKFREDLYYRLSTVVINVPPLSQRGEDIFLLARKFAADFSEKYMTAPITFSAEARRVMQLYQWPGNVRQLKNVVEQLALFEAGGEVSRTAFMQLLPSSGGEASTPAVAPVGYEAERHILWQTLLKLKQEVETLRAEILRLEGGVSSGDEMTHSGERRESVRSEIVPWVPAVTDIFGGGGPGNGAECGGTRAGLPVSEAPSSLEEAEKDAIAAALARNGGNKSKTAADLGISVRTLYRKINEYELS